MDLLVGTGLGEVWLVPNESKGKELAFGKPRLLEAAGQPVKVNGEAAPVAADWDGDGKVDLIVGAQDGSLVWYRNAGSPRVPKLEAPRRLLGESPVGGGGDEIRGPHDWGQRAKPCVVDWNGDGRLDLLLGDVCGYFLAKPSQTEQEKAEERRANDLLPGLRQKWAETFQRYRQTEDAKEQAELRTQLQRLKDEIANVQDLQSRYKEGNQSHGFVWLFLRKPGEKKVK
jgi:hypothetical protein